MAPVEVFIDTVRFEIAEIVGGVFAGALAFTVRTKLVLAVRDPSETVRVIVAVPVASPDRLEEVARWCDEVVCVLTPVAFHAVGQFYEDFTQVEDEEVVELLRRCANEAAPTNAEETRAQRAKH